MEPYIAPTRKQAKDTARRLVLDRSGSRLERAQSRFFTESVLKGECNCGQCEYIMCVFAPVRKPSQVAMVRWCRWCGVQAQPDIIQSEPTDLMEEPTEQGIEDMMEEPPLESEELIDVAPDLLQPTEESVVEVIDVFPDLLEPTEEDIFQALERKLMR